MRTEESVLIRDCQNRPSLVTEKSNSRKRWISDISPERWTSRNAEGRWCGFGPYYAMFPVDFARDVVTRFCPLGGVTLDPFCGRGTVPFVSMATGRSSFGSDINPVAWIYAKVKTDPYPETTRLIQRVRELKELITPADRIPENDFQELAWSQNVLAYLNAAKRELNWKSSQLDRTLMGILLIHLHAKLGDGLSNQMRQSKSMAPAYSVQWWKQRKMLPPEIEVVDFLTKKIEWRYAKGIVTSTQTKPMIGLGKAENLVCELPSEFSADLLFTSPPYCGVTNYRYDNWIRLWLLNEGPSLPNGEASQRYSNKVAYMKLLENVLSACSLKLKDTATIYIRTDARQFTLAITVQILKSIWPDKTMYFRADQFKKATQTALYGDKSPKPGEVDILLLADSRKKPPGFEWLATNKNILTKINLTTQS